MGTLLQLVIEDRGDVELNDAQIRKTTGQEIEREEREKAAVSTAQYTQASIHRANNKKHCSL